MDGTLLDAWASVKSVRSKDEEALPGSGRNNWTDFKGEKRTNETHASTSDPESCLYRKSEGQAAKPSYPGHALMENRHGLIKDVRVMPADGDAEQEAALSMVAAVTKENRLITLGADKGYDSACFIKTLVFLRVMPHVPPKKGETGLFDSLSKTAPLYMPWTPPCFMATRFTSRSICVPSAPTSTVLGIELAEFEILGSERIYCLQP